MKMPAKRTSLTLAAATAAAVVACFPSVVLAAGGDASRSMRLSDRVFQMPGVASFISVEESIGRVAPLKISRALSAGKKSLPLAKVSPEKSRSAKAAPVFVSQSAGLLPLSEENSPFLLAALQESQDTSDLARRVNDLLRDGMMSQEMAADLLAKLGRRMPSGVAQAVVDSSGGAVPRAVRDQDRPIALAPQSKPPMIIVSEAAPAKQKSTPRLALAQPQPKPQPSMEQPTDGAEVWVLSREDRTLRNVLERWAREANWMLSWEYPSDFQIEFDAQFEGDLIDAVAKVIDGLAGLQRPIRAEFYGGNRVLRIMSGRE